MNNNLSSSQNNFKLRIIIVGVVISLMFVVLIARVAKLQVYDFDYYKTRANNNHIQIVPTGALRGRIFDKNMQIIAGQTPEFDLVYYPDESKLPEEKVISLLEYTINLTTREKKIIEQSTLRTRREGLILRQQINYEDIAKITSLSFMNSGLEVSTRLNRQYPLKEVLATITGYVGKISENELKKIKADKRDADYYGVDIIGKNGLEKYYENYLRGMPGNKEIETTAGGRVVRIIRENPPTPGSDLISSIDIKLQKKIYEWLGEKNGAVVALNPKNGEVLALVSNKSYDPNVFLGERGEEREALFSDVNNPLLNRAISGLYPPASTFKPFVGLAGLEYNKRTLKEKIYCPGYFSLPGSSHRYRDWNRNGHGNVDFYKSLVSSVDTYYYGLAYATGIDILSSYIGEFNFGKVTGIDIGGENAGLMPSSAWKKNRFNSDWVPGDTVSVGIGQGYMLATPLQIAVAYSALANRGYAFQPHIITEIRNPITYENKKIIHKKIINLKITPEYIDAVINALAGVNIPGGTAAGAFIGTKYTSAGKTGTAQVISIAQDKTYLASELKREFHDHALYAGFAPKDDPNIVVVAVIENAGGGSANAAPIVRKVMDEYLLKVESQ